MNRPLLATDSEWAREAGGQGVIYVNPENSENTAEKICELIKSEDMRNNIVELGRQKLMTYSTFKTKIIDYFNHLDRAKLIGCCPEKLKDKIHWPT